VPKRQKEPVTPTFEVYPAASEPIVLPCSHEDQERHLRAFIKAFVEPSVQPRWLEFLIDRRSEWKGTPRSASEVKKLWKADKVMRMFAAQRQYCVRIPNPERTEACYSAMFGKSVGVYFGMHSPPFRITAWDADRRFSWEVESAILSFKAGKLALFFCHDGGVWRCERE